MNRREFVRTVMASSALGTAATNTGAAPATRPAGLVGDGVADDTEALQGLIDAGAGPVVLPGGVYRLTRPVVIRLRERGYTMVHGHGVTRVVMAGPGPAFRFVGTHAAPAHPEGVSAAVWDRERMPLLRDLEIRGDHPASIGVQFEGTMQAVMTGLNIRCCRVGVHFHGLNRNVILSHCHVYDNHDIGVHFDHVNLHQAIISACHISYNALAGIKVEGGDMRNFQFVGNDIEYNHDFQREGSADVLFDMVAGGSFREGAIVGNTIQARVSPRGANVRFLGGKGYGNGGLLTISGNLIGTQQTNIELIDCRGMVISGNSLYGADDRNLALIRCANLVVGDNCLDWNPNTRSKSSLDGILIDDCDGVNLANTIIENCLRATEAQGAAIEIRRSRDVTVANCQVLDPGPRGIRLADSQRCRVTGCSVVDRRPQPALRESILVEGGRDNVLEGNMVNQGTLAPGTAKAVNTHETTN